MSRSAGRDRCRLPPGQHDGAEHVEPRSVADIQGNLVPAVQLWNQMTRLGVRRIVYLSSGGPSTGNPATSPVPETHALNPICSYGVVKVAVENYLFMYKDLYGIEPVVLRPSNPVGPRQGHMMSRGRSHVSVDCSTGDPIQVWATEPSSETTSTSPTWRHCASGQAPPTLSGYSTRAAARDVDT